MQGAAMITLDTAANAKLATSNANESTMIAKMQESLQVFAHLLEQAKAQVNTLNQVHNTLGRTQEFTHARALPPLDSMIAHLQSDLIHMQERQQQLQILTKHYAELEDRQLARLQQACPWLDFNTATITDFSSDQAQDAQTFLENFKSSLRGKPLSLLVCERAMELKNKDAHNAHVKQMQEALLRGDLTAFQELQHTDAQTSLSTRHSQEQAMQARLYPLLKRLESLRQNFSNTHLQAQLQALHTELAEQLKLAKDENDQARAYAHYNQKAQSLQLECMLELTRHLAFLNETMAMGTALLATSIKNVSLSLPSTPKDFPSKLNTYGFPELTP